MGGLATRMTVSEGVCMYCLKQHGMDVDCNGNRWGVDE